MSRRRFFLVSIAVVADIGVSFLAWMVFQPGPYAFAAGHPVDLASYPGPSPTGVPAELAAADALIPRLTRDRRRVRSPLGWLDDDSCTPLCAAFISEP